LTKFDFYGANDLLLWMGAVESKQTTFGKWFQVL